MSTIIVLSSVVSAAVLRGVVRVPVACFPVMGMVVRLIRGLAILVMAATRVLLLLVVLPVVRLLLLRPVALVGVVRVVVRWGVALGRVARADRVADDPCPLIHQSCRRDGEALRRRSGHTQHKK